MTQVEHSNLSNPDAFISPFSDGDFFIPEPEHRVPQIVITGGPSSGKSTIVRQLSQHMPRLQTTKEAATIVLNDGWQLPDADHPWTQEWQNSLQRAVGTMQLRLEREVQTYAVRTAKSLIVQDRGLLDIAAYLANPADLPEYIGGMTAAEAQKRYIAVVHLGWISGKNYENNSNPIRFEDEADAKIRGDKVLECWSDHPNVIQIDCRKEHRFGQVLDIVLEVSRSLVRA